MFMGRRYIYTILFMFFWLLSGCGQPKQQCLEVTATAYTSSKRETDSTPFLAAWKNKLEPGVKCIAVSRDLLELGLTNGCVVTIDGLEGRYKVLDKMHKRWTRKIDIYMGLDRKKALEWGKQTVTIRWEGEPKVIKDTNQSLSLLTLPTDETSKQEDKQIL